MSCAASAQRLERTGVRTGNLPPIPQPCNLARDSLTRFEVKYSVAVYGRILGLTLVAAFMPGCDGSGSALISADGGTGEDGAADGSTNPAGDGGYAQGSPLFFDDFDYVVTDSLEQGSANREAFWAAGYSRIKAENVDSAGDGEQSTQTGGSGYLYTVEVSSIPGHTGAAPGSTSRALCINSRAGTDGSQTDFYFQLGSALGDIPANVYFQFWVYVARSGEQQSQFHAREKFIYPTRNSYPATIGNNGGHWIFELATNSSNPNGQAVTNSGEAFALSRDGTITSSTPFWDDANAANDGTTSHLGQADSATPLWLPNQWIETRIHYDTSGANGVYEVWTRAVGTPWTKRAEWIGGTTIDGSAFVWNIDPSFRDGHASIRVPTTMPGAGSATPQYDAWIYLQDFTMAAAAEDLPTYEGY